MNRKQGIVTMSNNVWGKAVSQNHTAGILLEFWNHDVRGVVTVKVLVAQLCLTLCDPMDCSLPSSSAHGILQARILEWLPVPFSRRSWPRDWTPVSYIAGRFFTIRTTGKSRYLALFPVAHLVFIALSWILAIKLEETSQLSPWGKKTFLSQ